MRLWRNWQTRYLEGVVFTRRMGSSPINRTIWIQSSAKAGLFYCRRELCYAAIGKGQEGNRGCGIMLRQVRGLLAGLSCLCGEKSAFDAPRRFGGV